MRALNSESGLGLAEVMVAAAIGTAVIGALAVSLNRSQQASRKISTDLDIVSVKGLIVQSVDCRATFPTPANPPCTIGENVVLRRTGGGAIVNADESSVFGPWRVRARCAANGVQVSVANNRPDEMNPQLIRDFNHPKAPIFAAGIPGLCNDRYTPAVGALNCGAGQIMRGINFETRQPVCEPLSSIVPTCGTGQILSFDGTSFSCVNDMYPSAGDIYNIASTAVNNIAPGIADGRINTLAPGIADWRINTFVPGIADWRINTLAPGIVHNYIANNVGRWGATMEQTGDTPGECASYSQMRCPEGYFAFAYEAKIEGGGDHCRISCRKFL